jgi:hypothetical protein
MSAQPQQRPLWEVKHEALCQEREAVQRRIEALTAQRNLLDVRIMEVLKA